MWGENNKTGAQFYGSHLKLNSLTEWILSSRCCVSADWIKDLYDSTAGGRLRNLIFAVILFIRLTVSCLHCYVLHTAVCCMKEGKNLFFSPLSMLPFNILFCILWVLCMLYVEMMMVMLTYFLFLTYFPLYSLILFFLCLVFKSQIFD